MDPAAAPAVQASLAAQQKELAIGKQFIDITRFDVETKAEELERDVTVNVLRPLYECLQAHWEYFHSGYSMMQRFKDSIDELKLVVEELESRQQDQTAHRRLQRRQLEKVRTRVACAEPSLTACSIFQGDVHAF